MANVNTGWRKLAEPTYATSRFGRTVQFPAGTEIRVTTNILRLDAGTVAARAGFPFECEAAPRSHTAACWYVTASALRFEEASLGERLGFQPIAGRTHGYNGQEHR